MPVDRDQRAILGGEYREHIRKKIFWTTLAKNKVSRWPFTHNEYVEDMSRITPMDLFGGSYQQMRMCTDQKFEKEFEAYPALVEALKHPLGEDGNNEAVNKFALSKELRPTYAFIVNGGNSNALLGKYRCMDIWQMSYQANDKGDYFANPNEGEDSRLAIGVRADALAKIADSEPIMTVGDFVNLLEAERKLSYSAIISRNLITPDGRPEDVLGRKPPKMEPGTQLSQLTPNISKTDNVAFESALRKISKSFGVELVANKDLPGLVGNMKKKTIFGALDTIKRRVSPYNNGISPYGWPFRTRMEYNNNPNTQNADKLYAIIKQLSYLQAEQLMNIAESVVSANENAMATNLPSIDLLNKKSESPYLREDDKKYSTNKRWLTEASACLIASELCLMMGMPQEDARAYSDSFRLETAQSLKMMTKVAVKDSTTLIDENHLHNRIRTKVAVKDSTTLMSMIANIHAIGTNNLAYYLKPDLKEYALNKGVDWDVISENMGGEPSLQGIMYASNIKVTPELAITPEMDSDAIVAALAKVLDESRAPVVETPAPEIGEERTTDTGYEAMISRIKSSRDARNEADEKMPKRVYEELRNQALRNKMLSSKDAQNWRKNKEAERVENLAPMVDNDAPDTKNIYSAEEIQKLRDALNNKKGTNGILPNAENLTDELETNNVETDKEQLANGIMKELTQQFIKYAPELKARQEYERDIITRNTKFEDKTNEESTLPPLLPPQRGVIMLPPASEVTPAIKQRISVDLSDLVPAKDVKSQKYRTTNATQYIDDIIFDVIMEYAGDKMLESNSIAKQAGQTVDESTLVKLNKSYDDSQKHASVGSVVGAMYYAKKSGNGRASDYNKNSFPGEALAVQQIEAYRGRVMDKVKEFIELNADSLQGNKVTVRNIRLMLETLGESVYDGNDKLKDSEKRAIGVEALKDALRGPISETLDNTEASLVDPKTAQLVNYAYAQVADRMGVDAQPKNEQQVEEQNITQSTVENASAEQVTINQESDLKPVEFREEYTPEMRERSQQYVAQNTDEVNYCRSILIDIVDKYTKDEKSLAQTCLEGSRSDKYSQEERNSMARQATEEQVRTLIGTNVSIIMKDKMHGTQESLDGYRTIYPNSYHIMSEIDQYTGFIMDKTREFMELNGIQDKNITKEDIDKMLETAGRYVVQHRYDAKKAFQAKVDRGEVFDTDDYIQAGKEELKSSLSWSVVNNLLYNAHLHYADNDFEQQNMLNQTEVQEPVVPQQVEETTEIAPEGEVGEKTSEKRTLDDYADAESMSR